MSLTTLRVGLLTAVSVSSQEAHFLYLLNFFKLRRVLSHFFFFFNYTDLLDFPGGSDGKESAHNCRKPRFNPWVGKILWRKEWQSTPGFLPGESHGWTVESGGPQSMGSQRVRRDWVTNTFTFIDTRPLSYKRAFLLSSCNYTGFPQLIIRLHPNTSTVSWKYH